MPIFADRIKELRKAANITQKAVAQAIDMAERAYQDLEYGKYNPNYESIVKLADYFDVSADYLIGRSNNKSWDCGAELDSVSQ